MLLQTMIMIGCQCLCHSSNCSESDQEILFTAVIVLIVAVWTLPFTGVKTIVKTNVVIILTLDVDDVLQMPLDAPKFYHINNLCDLNKMSGSARLCCV